jgi:hypothetical protein
MQTITRTIFPFFRSTAFLAVAATWCAGGVSCGSAVTAAPEATLDPSKGDASAADSATSSKGDASAADSATSSLDSGDSGTPITQDGCIRQGAIASGTVVRVGPTRAIRTINEVQAQLKPGDRVEVDGNATYPSLTLVAAGTAEAPIVFVGIAVNGKLPVLSGGDDTLYFNGSHHVVFQGFEITQGVQVCVLHQAHDVALCQTVVHDCARHGILGADYDSGSLLLDRIEVHHTGGEPAGENLKHPVYIATDPVAYPDGVFRIQHSYLHDNNGGNAIKSRALRTEIYFNWIETGPSMLYSAELIGFEEFTSPRQDSDVVGNVLIHQNQYGLRFGGDGTGASKGRVRFANNLVVVSGSGYDANTPVLRFFSDIDALEAVNNVFYRVGGGPLRVIRDDATWVRGQQTLAGTRNWVPQGSTEVPASWTATVFGTSPGFANLSSVSAFDLTVRSDAAIARAGVALSAGTSGFEIANPLRVLSQQPPAVRPSTFLSTPELRAIESTPTLGPRSAP